MIQEEIERYLENKNRIKIHDFKYKKRLVLNKNSLEVQKFCGESPIYNLQVKDSDFHPIMRIKTARIINGILIIMDESGRKVKLRNYSY